jgi:uncharacterized PurR-regulated membrane protein YhhQ (DUF165 family)
LFDDVVVFGAEELSDVLTFGAELLVVIVFGAELLVVVVFGAEEDDVVVFAGVLVLLVTQLPYEFLYAPGVLELVFATAFRPYLSCFIFIPRILLMNLLLYIETTIQNHNEFHYKHVILKHWFIYIVYFWHQISRF